MQPHPASILGNLPTGDRRFVDSFAVVLARPAVSVLLPRAPGNVGWIRASSTAKPRRSVEREEGPEGKSKGRSQRGDKRFPQLVVLEPPSEAGREFLVNGELTIGRAASCHVTLDDTYISQLHARVAWRSRES